MKGIQKNIKLKLEEKHKKMIEKLENEMGDKYIKGLAIICAAQFEAKRRERKKFL